MRVFVGYGYNDRDKWIEEKVLPILRCAGFTVLHGRKCSGKELPAEVRGRLDESDAAIGFFTIRPRQGKADFTSHLWVRDEILYAIGRDKPIVLIREKGVRLPDGLVGNRQFIHLNQDDRLGCVAEMLQALALRNIRRVKLEPESEVLNQRIWKWRNDRQFTVRYRARDTEEQETSARQGRIETVDQGYYLTLYDVPTKGQVSVEGILNGDIRFDSGWVTADAAKVPIR
jgi:hypothetical protein